MRNYYIAISVLGIFVLIILTIGFFTISNPFLEQDKNNDQKRQNDLSMIHNAINDYYSKNYRLPDSLPFQTTYMPNISFSDPVTKLPYIYKITSPSEYQLCATFATDTTIQSSSEKNATASTSSLNIPTLGTSENIHPKGYYCFSYNTGGYNGYNPQPVPVQYTYPSTTPIPPPPPPDTTPAPTTDIIIK